MADVSKTIEIIVETKDAVKELDKLNESLDENKDETKEAKEETKKYDKQLQDTSKVTGAFTGQLDRMTGGLFSSAKGILTTIKGLKSLRLALIATGLGAVVLVVGAITTAFSRLEGPMRLITEITGGLGSVFNVLLDRIGLVGEAFIKLGSGDIAGGIEKLAESWTGISDSMREAFDLGVLIARQTRENSLNESARNAVIAKNNRELERELLLSRDIDRSIKDRQESIERANEIGLENLALQRKTAEEQLTIAKNQFEDSSKNNADRIAFNEALAQFHNSQLGFEKTLRDLENRRVDLLRQQLQVEKQSTTELQKQVKLTEEVVDDTLELGDNLGLIPEKYDDISKSIEKYANAQSIALKEGAEDTIELEGDQTELAKALGVTGEAAKGALDIFSGKTTGKDIFKFFLTTLGSILGLVTGGGVGGAIVGLIGGLFSDGGMINGPSHSQGGTWINTEGGEGVLNKRSMAIPWVRSLASELNQIGGGVSFGDGGITPGPTAQEAQINDLTASLQQQRIVLPIEDLFTLETKVTAIEDRATLR